MTVTTTPQQIGTGATMLVVTVVDDGTVGKEYVQFGFGAVAPTEWHAFYPGNNQVLNIGIGMGAIWLKVPSGTLQVNISTGV